MNKAKIASKIDGKKFLREAFAAEQAVLALQLNLSSRSITHDGLMGEVGEQHFIDVLRKYLPQRYEISQGIVIDSNGLTSDQIDIVIFDHQYTPTLLDQKAHRFIPVEAVYCILEVKPTLNKQYLEYAAEKAESVRRLERTSVAISHAGGEYPPKNLFPIIGGVVANNVDWIDGLSSTDFSANLAKLKDTKTLDCGLVLSDRAFDTFSGSLTISERQNSLMVFIFRLLQRLQTLGTAPAVDWNKYSDVLAAKDSGL
jgi:hypothetical protein